eukprot:gene25802-27_t
MQSAANVSRGKFLANEGKDHIGFHPDDITQLRIVNGKGREFPLSPDTDTDVSADTETDSQDLSRLPITVGS